MCQSIARRGSILQGFCPPTHKAFVPGVSRGRIYECQEALRPSALHKAANQRHSTDSAAERIMPWPLGKGSRSRREPASCHREGGARGERPTTHYEGPYFGGTYERVPSLLYGLRGAPSRTRTQPKPLRAEAATEGRRGLSQFKHE